MKATIASKFLFREMVDKFDYTDSGQKDLKEHLSHLERLLETYAQQSVNPKIAPRHRARARDLEQNARGIICGIKFGIAFMQGQEIDS